MSQKAASDKRCDDCGHVWELWELGYRLFTGEWLCTGCYEKRGQPEQWPSRPRCQTSMEVYGGGKAIFGRCPHCDRLIVTDEHPPGGGG